MSHLTVFPAHTLFQILDRSVVLRPGELLIGPSTRFLIICAEATDEWSALFAEHCTGEYTEELYLLPSSHSRAPRRRNVVDGTGPTNLSRHQLPGDRRGRVSEALCMRFNPQSRRRVRNNDCCVPEEA